MKATLNVFTSDSPERERYFLDGECRCSVCFDKKAKFVVKIDRFVSPLCPDCLRDLKIKIEEVL